MRLHNAQHSSWIGFQRRFQRALVPIAQLTYTMPTQPPCHQSVISTLSEAVSPDRLRREAVFCRQLFDSRRFSRSQEIRSGWRLRRTARIPAASRWNQINLRSNALARNEHSARATASPPSVQIVRRLHQPALDQFDHGLLQRASRLQIQGRRKSPQLRQEFPWRIRRSRTQLPRRWHRRARPPATARRAAGIA